MPRRTAERIGRRQPQCGRQALQTPQPSAWVLIGSIETGREVECLDGVVKPRPSNRVPRGNPRADAHVDATQVRIRSLEPTAMIERDRQHSGHRADKSHSSGSCSTHRGSQRHVVVDAPVPAVRAHGGEIGDYCGVNRRRQTSAMIRECRRNSQRRHRQGESGNKRHSCLSCHRRTNVYDLASQSNRFAGGR